MDLLHLPIKEPVRDAPPSYPTSCNDQGKISRPSLSLLSFWNIAHSIQSPTYVAQSPVECATF